MCIILTVWSAVNYLDEWLSAPQKLQLRRKKEFTPPELYWLDEQWTGPGGHALLEERQKLTFDFLGDIKEPCWVCIDDDVSGLQNQIVAILNCHFFCHLHDSRCSCLRK